MSKNFELTAYSNCSREFTLDIDGALIEVLPVSMILVGKPAIFLLFPPLEKHGDPAVYLDDWARDLRRFTTAFEDYADASFMYQGLEAVADEAGLCRCIEECFGVSVSACSLQLFEFDPVWVAVLERMVRADLSTPLAYEEATALCEPVENEQQNDYFNRLLVDAWLSGQEDVVALRVRVDQAECEFEGLEAQYIDAKNQLEAIYLELSDLKAIPLISEVSTPVLVAESRDEATLALMKTQNDSVVHKLENKILILEKDSDKENGAHQSEAVELNKKMLALGQEKELLLLQVTQNQEELETFYLQNYSLRSRLSGLLPYQAKDLLHFVAPQPLAESRQYYSVLFDDAYYLGQLKTRLRPFLHYRFFGWKRGAEPHPLFNSEYYLEQLGVSRDSLKLAPLVHYFRIGFRINADTHPHFDSKFYLNEYPDVFQSRVPALLHYLTFGWKEGRNPNKTFDTTTYLQSYPDVAESGMNPLVHFVLFGEAEGRRGGTW